MTRDEMRQKWLDALRSGEYGQGKGNLCAEGKFCCLGVACEVLKKELDLRVSHLRSTVVYDDNVATTPERLVDALGLYGDCGEHQNPSTENPPLVALNDDKGLSFSEIADKIETGDYWQS